jgi:hypothetical protein
MQTLHHKKTKQQQKEQSDKKVRTFMFIILATYHFTRYFNATIAIGSATTSCQAERKMTTPIDRAVAVMLVVTRSVSVRLLAFNVLWCVCVCVCVCAFVCMWWSS